MLLYHFSDKKFDKIKIEYFGYNSYTNNDKKYKTNRFFCYNVDKPIEYHLKNCSYRYTIKIEDKKIYNLDTDILKLKEKYSFDIDKILKYIAKSYTACFYTHSFTCYCVFKDIIPLKIDIVK